MWIPDTHRVFFTADQQTAAYVSQVISNLDRPKPQVLIKVVFLQVTYNNGYDVGVEGGDHQENQRLDLAQRFESVWAGPAADCADIRHQYPAGRRALHHRGE